MLFEVEKNRSGTRARIGNLVTPHGKVKTPVFMPVGTQGAVKTLAPWELDEIGFEIILANTYHLHLRPGENLIAEMGGLQHWTTWSKPMLTDSGGYQAFSLGVTKGRLSKITDQFVKFSSHLDGNKVTFTPEGVLDIQYKLGSDIVMVLDDCAPYPANRKRLETSVVRTGEWAKKSYDYWLKKEMGQGGRALFGIVQGGMEKDLRQESLRQIQAIPFDGIAIGGVSVGEGKAKMLEAVNYIAEDLDPARPHYLMGVGEPGDLIRMIDRGIDMFDCVLATRLARHGAFWVQEGFKRLNIKSATFAQDEQALDPSCQCRMCRTFSRSYIRHLFMSNESLAWRILSYHNLYLLHNLIREIRVEIEQGTFTKKYREYLKAI